MTLFELAAHFQRFGELLSEVYEYQIDYIMQSSQEIYDDYIEKYKDMAKDQRPDFQYHMAEWMNAWIVDNGFSQEITDKEYNELVEEHEDMNLKEMLRVGEEDEKENKPH